MSIARTIENFVNDKQVQFTIVSHPKSQTSLGSAHCADVNASKLAKAVLLSGKEQFVLAVLPADRELELETIENELKTTLMITPEENLVQAFGDCARGAVPALGAAYGIPTIIDSSFADMDEVYFEAGDHEELIHVSGGDFHRLQPDARVVQFSHPRN